MRYDKLNIPYTFCSRVKALANYQFFLCAGLAGYSTSRHCVLIFVFHYWSTPTLQILCFRSALYLKISAVFINKNYTMARFRYPIIPLSMESLVVVVVVVVVILRKWECTRWQWYNTQKTQHKTHTHTHTHTQHTL